MRKGLIEFIAAIKADDANTFIEAIAKYEHGTDLRELIQAASRKHLVEISEGLLRRVELAVAIITEEQDDGAAGEDTAGNQDPEDVIAKQMMCLNVFYAAAIVARAVFAETTASPPEALHATAVLLHDFCLAGMTIFLEMHDEVAKLCLEWWQAEAPGHDDLTPRTVVFLLTTAIESGTAAAVKRVYAIREAMRNFVFDDPSIEDLKRLLVRAAFAPSFLRCAEGRRFVAFLFTLQPAFVRELTAVIKNQVPAGRKSILDAYGEIIFRAWNTASGACLLEVKQACIQELMEAAILASTPTLASALRRLLGGLHCQKAQTGVDALLLELYEPIIFRRLNAANPAVRRNALELFVDAFPLRDPEETLEATNIRMTAQFAALTAALKDDVPAVRAAAVAGVGRVLGTFWELIPAPVTAGYVKSLAADLAFDAASPAVRAAAVDCVTALVDNPLAHPVLNVVLPKLGPLLHDPSPKVRASFVDLLLSLRTTKELQWHAVVDVSHLLEAMAMDGPAVSERIQRLLLPTYFPDAANGPSQVAGLLRASPAAGRAFCLYLAGASLPASGGVAAVRLAPSGPAVAQHCLTTLIKDLIEHLEEVPLVSEAERAKIGAKKPRNKRKKGRRTKKKSGVGQGEEEEEEEEDEDSPVVETRASWMAILQGIAAVCCGLGARISAGSVEAAAANKLVSGATLARLLERCPGEDTVEAVATIAAALPNTPGAAAVRKQCMAVLCSDDAGNNQTATTAVGVRAALDCVVAHPAACDALLGAMGAAFGADPEEICPPAEQVKGPRKAEAHDASGLTQATAVGHLATMLELEGPRKFLLASGALARLLPWVGAALGARVADVAEAVSQSAAAEEAGSIPDAGAGMLSYLKACLHLLVATEAAEDNEDSGNDETKEPEVGPDAKDQALKSLQQAMQWGTLLLQRLGDVDAATLAAALAPLPAQPAKRTKGARSRAGPSAAQQLQRSGPDTALREAFSAAQTCIAVAGEAAKLRALGWQGAGASWAPSASRLAQLFVGVVHRIAVAPQNEAGEAVLLAISHAARLARNLAAGCGAAAACTVSARDLGSELAQAAAAVAGSPGAACDQDSGDAAVSLLAGNIFAVMCDCGDAATAARSHTAGLVAALCKSADGERQDGKWLHPVAALLAAGIDAELASAEAQQQQAAVTLPGANNEAAGAGGDENSNANAEENNQRPARKRGAAGRTGDVSLLSEARDAPVVKQLVAAAKFARANEAAAGQAARLAGEAWAGGHAALALGYVELAQALGFQGTTVRGRSRAGGFSAVVKQLNELSMVVAESEGCSDPHATVLRAKLLALFPPQPRVSFGVMAAAEVVY